MINDRDTWSDRELAEGDAYATTSATVLKHALDGLHALHIPLAGDKRATVELAALLELAAKLAQHKLQMSADDFATSACDVFMHTH